MTPNGYLQLALYVVVLIALAKPLGAYMANVYEGRSLVTRLGASLEHLIYRLCGVDPEKEMRWTQYAIAMLLFNLLGLLAVYVLQRFQANLPLNPQGFAAVSTDSSFNTAVSFATNTNWQGYGGESTMSYLTQMLALTVQNFVSAATGMAVLVALIAAMAGVSSGGWVFATPVLIVAAMMARAAWDAAATVALADSVVARALQDAGAHPLGAPYGDQAVASSPPPAASSATVPHAS